jgi:hypothetical protein
MKIRWLIKELLSVLFILTASLIIAIWATLEASNSSGYPLLIIGFLTGFIPIMTEFIVAYQRETLFVRKKEAISAKMVRNKKNARHFLIPAVVFGIAFVYFPKDVKTLFLSAVAGYLLPFSIFLTFYFTKNHKAIEKITKNINTKN